MNLLVTEDGKAQIPFLGATYLVSNEGVERFDGEKFLIVIGSALIHYLLKNSTCQPAGTFVSIGEIAGPWLKRSSFSKSALESPIIKRFQERTPELLSTAESIGGRQEGLSGLGSISLIFDLLPNILLQLIFYDQDDEFPARATLLIDANAIEFIDFEALAFLLSIFVQHLVTFQEHTVFREKNNESSMIY